MPQRESIESAERALQRRRGTQGRTAPDGERWLDCRCPLHDDAHRSASFSVDRGTFHCRVCSPGSSIPLEKVLAALAIPEPPVLHSAGRQSPNGQGPGPKLAVPEIETGRWSYDYYWPNGELSHRHWRIQLTTAKRYLHQSPDGSWNRPATYYPIYGDLGLEPGAHLVLTEGEPACDAVNTRSLQLSGVPVAAITAGSTSDLLQAVEILAVRLGELRPSTLTLWPDADEPGIKAMRQVRKRLEERHIPAVLLKPEDFQLAGKDDAVEFLQRGGDLGLLLSSLHRPRGLLKPQDVADQLVVTAEGVLWPSTESIWRLNQSVCSALWQEVTGKMPADRDAKELLNLLSSRQARGPAIVHWRLYAEPYRMVWRPAPLQECYQITPQGIELVPDSPSGLLLTPGRARVPPEADENGTEEHYLRLCRFFGLSELEQVLILAWLCCCLLGRETPILLMRGAAGTGKSTLASFVLGLVEPTLREIDLEGQRSFSDHRQLLQTLRQVPAALIDNLTVMSASMEDVLSRLVTGYSSSVMWKYSNEVEQIWMHRGIIITTTSYDVYKGDLASRMVVCQPRIQGGWVDRQDIDRQFLPLLPLVRGYVFRQVHRILAAPPLQESSFRVASVGKVLRALGHDAAELARQESAQKAEMLNQNDPWMHAMVDIWDRENQGGEFLLSLSQIVDKMRETGVPFDVLPATSGPRFARWAEEKRMLLRDHGFTLERYRDEKMRGYWFRRVKG